MKARMHAVSVLLFTPRGIPLVRDRTKPTPHYWKLPGGKGMPGHDSPAGIAVKKIQKKIGVSLAEGDLTLAHTEDRGDHDFSLFVARLPKVDVVEEKGPDGEEVSFFDPQEMLGMGNLFPNHRPLVQSQLAPHRSR